MEYIFKIRTVAKFIQGLILINLKININKKSIPFIKQYDFIPVVVHHHKQPYYAIPNPQLSLNQREVHVLLDEISRPYLKNLKL